VRESGRGEGEGAIGQARHRGHAAAAPEAGPSDDHPKLLHAPQNKNKKTNTTFPQVLLKKEGSEEGAIDALGRVMLAAHGHLAKVANGEELFPRFHLTDPVFARESHGLGSDLEEMVGKVAGTVKGKMPVKSVTKFAAAKTFFNYAPCVLSESTVRVSFPLGVVWLVLGGSRGAGTRPRGRGLGCTGQRDNA
jgi:hypothetical protein